MGTDVDDNIKYTDLYTELLELEKRTKKGLVEAKEAKENENKD